MTAEKRHETIGPYRVIEKMTEGAMGRIYKVEKDGHILALKIPKIKDVAGVGRFRREAAAIARLNHENLVRVVDIGEFENEPFIAMELVEGENLQTTIRGELPQFDELLRIATSIASALSEIHRFRMIHRDIKPSNVMIDRAGKVKVLDLGLVENTVDFVESDTKNSIIGTFEYSSPEQLGMLKRPVDARSDLYSLGVTLFELATGRLPFVAPTRAELLQMHAAIIPPKINELKEDINPVLAEIIAKLLEKDPDNRYQSAQGLIYDLKNFKDLDSRFRAKGAVALGTNDGFFLQNSLPLIGREDELASLQRSWQSLSQKTGCFVLIEGEGGLGKSRLGQEVVSTARQEGALILTAKCQSLGNSTALGPIREICDNLVDVLFKLPAEESHDFESKVRSAAKDVEGILKQLSRGFNILFKDHETIAVDSNKFGDEAAQFFAKLSNAFGKVLFLIDDIQWIDNSSIEILEKFSGHLKESPTLVLLTARNDLESEKRLNEFKNIFINSIAQTITLKPLSLDAVDTLIAHYLGGKHLERPFVFKINSAANGNPFAIGEFIRSLSDSAHLRLENGSWTIDPDRLRDINLSKDVFQLILGRLKNLDTRVGEILSYGAIIGNRFDYRLLSEILGIEEDKLIYYIQVASEQNLINLSEGTVYQFVHDRIKEALLSSLSPEETAKRNNQVAHTYDKRDDDNPDFLLARARHFRNGTPIEHFKRAFETNLVAADYCAATSAHEMAYEIYKFCLDLQIKTNSFLDHRKTLSKRFAVECVLTAHFDEAHAVIDEFLPHAEGLEKAELFQIKMNAFKAAGHFNLAWRMMKLGLVSLGLPLPRTVLSFVFRIAYHLFLARIRIFKDIVFGQRPRRHLNEKTKKYELAANYLLECATVCGFRGDSLGFMYICTTVAHYSTYLGDPKLMSLGGGLMSWVTSPFHLSEWTKLFSRYSLENAERVKDPGTLNWSQLWVAGAKEQLGLLSQAERELVQATSEAKKFASAFNQCVFMSVLFHNYFHRGLLLQSIDLIEREMALFDRVRQIVFRSKARFTLYGALIMAGRIKEAQQIRDESNRLIDESGIENTKTVLIYLCYASLIADYELDNFTSDTDHLIDLFKSLAVDDYWAKIGTCVVTYIRLAQYEKAKDGEDRKRTWQKAKEALRMSFLTVYEEEFRCHYYTALAIKNRLHGQFKSALKALDKAEKMASKTETVWGLINCYVEKARVHKALGEESKSRFYAVTAMDLASTNGFNLRSQKIIKEFHIDLGKGSQRLTRSTRLTHATNVPLTKNMTSGTLNETSVLPEFRLAETLLQVSLASARSIEVVDQTRAVLDEVIKLLGVEKAFVFQYEKEQDTFQLIVGRTAKKEDTSSTTPYSSTVVKRVHQTRESVLISHGAEDDLLQEAQSAIINDLKSILAVPIKLRDEFMGILYLDSSLAKGLLNEADVPVVSAIASHIAVAFEMARTAKLEIERARLEKELAIQTLIAEVSKKVTNLVDNMQQALFSVDSEGKIVEPVSRYSRSVFGTDIAGKSFIDLVYKDLPSASEELSHLKTTLSTVFGEGEIQWELMNPNIPRRVSWSEKILAVKPAPLWDEQGELNQIMVVVEDITEIEKLSKQVAEQSKKAFILQTLLEIDKHDLQDFFEVAEKTVSRCRSLSEDLSNSDCLREVMRQLHTLKGTARLYNLTLVSSTVHEVESDVLKVSEALKLNVPLDLSASDSVKKGLEMIANQVQEYKLMADKVFSHESEESRGFIEVTRAGIRRLENLLKKFENEGRHQELKKAYNELFETPFIPSLQKFRNMVSDISSRLNKEVEFRVTGEDFTLPKETIHVVEEAVLHLIRNSLDHGIEFAEERQKVGKPRAGFIEVQCSASNSEYSILIKDDGKGIDGDFISKIALKKGLINESQLASMSKEEKLNLIFEPNFSTKDSASEISGRGVGMDIVKSSIEGIGGEVRLTTIPGKETKFQIYLKAS